jgi:hypothetical protein
MGMQDKYTIGPVTIVQLVGLQAKPKITSVQADGAVRAADLVPSSAAVGLGNDLSMPIDEIIASSHNLKTAPSLGLVTSPPGARIALEAGADRPVVDADAPAPAIDLSAFDLLLQKLGLTLPSTTDRATPSTIVPTITDTDRLASADGITTSTPKLAGLLDDAVIFDAPFDGAVLFGDDQILDFTINIDNAEFSQDIMGSNNSSSADDTIISSYSIDDWGGFAIIDCAGCISPEPQMMNNDFEAPVHQLSATDAFPLT